MVHIILFLLLLSVVDQALANALGKQMQPLVGKKVAWTIFASDLGQDKELVTSAFKLAKLMQDEETISWLFSTWGAPLAAEAIMMRRHVAIKEMLELGLDVNTVNKKGNSLLHIVLEYYNGSKKIIELLLKAGADVNAVNNKGETPLHIATKFRYLTDRHEYRDKSKIKLLLEAGADVNAINNKGETPMHIATYDPSIHYITHKYRSGYREMVELLEAGADADIVNNKGETPLDIALAIDSTAKQKLLLQNTHL